MNNTQDLKQVLQKKQEILQGNAERVAKQRAQGKLTARERVAKLVDQGSFVEMDVLVSEKDGGAGGAALADSARCGLHSQVGACGAYRGEFRRVRLRARCRGHGCDRLAGPSGEQFSGSPRSRNG